MSSPGELARQAVEATDFASGLQIADTIANQSEPDEALYRDTLLQLAERVETALNAANLMTRLNQLAGCQLEHREALAAALAVAAGHVESTREGLGVAASISQLSGYGASLKMQESRASALFRCTAREADAAELTQAATEIEALPSFRDSLPMQRACARTLCNATGQVDTAEQAQPLLAKLEQLPGRTDPEIQEAIRRAQHNLSRLKERDDVRAQARRTSRRRIALALSVVLVTVAALAILPPLMASLVNRGGPTELATTRPFDLQMQAAEKALAGRRFSEAEAQLEVAVTLAQRDENEPGRISAVTKLIEVHDQQAHYDQTITWILKLDKPRRPAYIEDFFSRARTAHQAGDHEVALTRLGQVEKLQDSLPESSFETRVYKAAVLESAGRPDEALDLYRQLQKERPDAPEVEARVAELTQLAAEAHLKAATKAFSQRQIDAGLEELKEAKELARGLPDPKGFEAQITALKLESTRELLSQAQQALVSADYAGAVAIANDAGRLVGKNKPELAALATVRAKAAYLQKDYRQAFQEAARASELAPGNKDYATRLATYKQADLEHVDRAELMSADFQFPPARRSGGSHTGIYILSSHEQEWVGQGREINWSPRHDTIKVNPSYSYDGKSPRGVNISIQTAENSWYNITFSAGEKAIRPGRFRVGRDRYDWRGPRLSFSGDGRASSNESGEFVIHEVSFSQDKKRVLTFAADFLQKGDRGYPVWGQVRYRSAYD
ncbi:MAG: tetratricopeptide repeat protein [Vulcanimicrobiota bacterium]